MDRRYPDLIQVHAIGCGIVCRLVNEYWSASSAYAGMIPLDRSCSLNRYPPAPRCPRVTGLKPACSLSYKRIKIINNINY